METLIAIFLAAMFIGGVTGDESPEGLLTGTVEVATTEELSPPSDITSPSLTEEREMVAGVEVGFENPSAAPVLFGALIKIF